MVLTVLNVSQKLAMDPNEYLMHVSNEGGLKEFHTQRDINNKDKNKFHGYTTLKNE